MPVSEVKNDINTDKKFLTQTGRFVLGHQCSFTQRLCAH